MDKFEGQCKCQVRYAFGSNLVHPPMSDSFSSCLEVEVPEGSYLWQKVTYYYGKVGDQHAMVMYRNLTQLMLDAVNAEDKIKSHDLHTL